MKKLRIMILIGMLLVSSAAIAGANYIHYKVDAVDRGIKVIVDGKQRDVATTPIVIDDKVMISLRDAAKIFNKSVSWDGNKNLVTIGKNTTISKPANKVAFKYIEDMTVIRNVGPFYQPKRTIAVAGQSFNHGIVVDLDPTQEAQKAVVEGVPRIKADVKLLLNGNYRSMDGYVAVEDASMNANKGFTMRIFGDNRPIYESAIIQPAEFANFISNIDLRNVKVLKIEFELEESPIPGETSIIKAALANVKLYKK